MKHDLEFILIMLLMMAGIGAIGLLMLGIMALDWVTP
jgi:hypothetical protein